MLVTTHRARRISGQFQAAPLVVQTIKDQQPAAEWLTKVQENLNGFQCLKAADNAYDGRNNTVIGTGLIRFFGFLIQTAIAGAVRPFRQKNGQLSFHTDRST